MRRSLLLASALAALTSAGCASTVTAQRTRPDLETTGRALARPATRGILVLSPSTLADVNVEWAVPRAAGFAVPTAAVERALFDAGWDPVARPALQKLVTTHKTALAIRETTGRDGAQLVDLAGLLGPASTADVTLLVNGWSTAWEPVPGGRSSLAQLCTVATEVRVSLHDRTGRLLWDARARGRSTDLLDLTMVDRSLELSHPQYACASRQASCGDCPAVVEADVLKRLFEHTARTAVRDLAQR